MAKKHQFKTTNIKGKQYVEVNERIKFFRTDAAYKGYSLTSRIIDLNEKECVIIAEITDSTNRLVATGIAHEIKSASRINATSFVENCETSAWGRALGNLGIGIDTSIASADEVATAIHQEANPPRNDKDVFAQALKHLESSTSKESALARILNKYESQFSPAQIKKLKSLV
jgi:hypothetical protein